MLETSTNQRAIRGSRSGKSTLQEKRFFCVIFSYSLVKEPTSSPRAQSTNSLPQDESKTSALDFMKFTKQKKRTVIYVMVSGRTCQPATKIVLTEADLSDWNAILAYLSHLLDVAEGVQCICSVTGKQIMGPADLHHGELYVAVPFNSKFKHMDYVKLFLELNPKKKFVYAKKLKRGRKSSLSKDKTKKSVVEVVEEKEGEDTENQIGSSSAQVQTTISAPTFKGPLELVDSYIDDFMAVQYKSSLLNKDEEEKYYDSVFELVRSILEDLLESCLLHLESENKLPPPEIGPNVPIADKMFIPNPEDKELDLMTTYPTKFGENFYTDLLYTQSATNSSKELTSFAEIAKNRKRENGMRNASLLHPSYTQPSENLSDNNTLTKQSSQTSFRKSVSFVKVKETGLPHTETIYEENEPLLPNFDISSIAELTPKTPILKVRQSDADPLIMSNHSEEIAEIDLDSNNDAAFNKVKTTMESENTESHTNSKDILEELKAKSSLFRTRDSIGLTLKRLSKLELDNLQKMISEQNQEKNTDEDQISYAYYLPDADYSDIYENYEKDSLDGDYRSSLIPPVAPNHNNHHNQHVRMQEPPNDEVEEEHQESPTNNKTDDVTDDPNSSNGNSTLNEQEEVEEEMDKQQLGCLRENCPSFSCSEICLRDCGVQACHKNSS